MVDPHDMNRTIEIALVAALAALLSAFALTQSGCYGPDFAEGLPCSPTMGCPEGQMCFSDGRCYSEDPGDNTPAVTTLASLEISLGTLEPAFDPAVTEYTVDLGLRAPELGITATPLASEGVELAIASASATPGEASAQPLLFGPQSIAITVTNIADESTTYTITADRGAAMAFTSYIKASNAEAGDLFGMGDSNIACLDNPCRPIAISGDTIAVGAPGEAGGLGGINGAENNNNEPGAGAVYVFVRGSDGSWSQQAYIKPARIDPDDNFGTSVALDGDTLVVGAPNEDSIATTIDGSDSDNNATDAGAAFVFVRSGAEWTQQAYLKPFNTDAGDRFGYSVAVSGETVAVGAPREASAGRGINQPVEDDDTASSAGAAYVFVRNGASWSQQAYIKASNADQGDQFHQVFLVGETLVVGAPQEGSGSTGVNGDPNNNDVPGAGAAYLFERNGVAWTQTNYFKASNPADGAIGTFGGQISFAGDLLVVGRPLETSAGAGINGDQTDTSGGEHVGAAYAFRNDGGTWAQEAYVKPSNSKSGAAQAYFGAQIALLQNLAVISGPQERSDGQGIGAEETNQRAGASGALYLFHNRDGAWSQESYIKTPNSETSDRSGIGLALGSDGTLVISSGDDSSATGVNASQQDQLDNSAIDSGAVFIIE